MCGILGGTQKNWNYNKALDSIKHRGPDGQRIVEKNEITMGFARLSIVDLSEAGMQPMCDDEGKIWITFNGEIYGYDSIRENLKKKGMKFNNLTDTEVILNAYKYWGQDFIRYIDGMYAIAIYDSSIHKLLLYRDRVGIKPLYYYYFNNRFAYCSELKGITTLLNDVSLKIDKTAIFDYYNYLYIPEPKTAYKHVFKLEAGSKLIFDVEKKNIIECSRYWYPNVCCDEKSIVRSDYIENAKNLIAESVKKQLVADVDVCGFLSGGIDSSVVTDEALKIFPNYKTYAIGFYDYNRNELPYVESFERYKGIKTEKYYVKNDEFQSLYKQLKRWYDEPYADTSAYPSFVVSREASKKFKVALSGDGGDEVFGGYPKYLEYEKKCNEGMFSDVESELEFMYEAYLFRPLPDIYTLRKMLGIPNDYDIFWFYRKHFNKELPPATRWQLMDFCTYLPGDILTKMDRVSMAVSLEVRVPLLSREIVEYIFSLPQEMRFDHGLKSILKLAYKNEIPRNLLFRRKAGFSIPDSFFGYGIMPQNRIINDIFDEYIKA